MAVEQVFERTEVIQPTTRRLDGKVAVITGAGSGMGLAIAKRFAAEGAKIVAADWNVARLDQAVAAIREADGTVVSATGNIADPLIAEGLIELAVSTYGRIDVLVNNAGVRRSGCGLHRVQAWTGRAHAEHCVDVCQTGHPL